MTRLLISVRSAREALDAIAGGADIIDVKEPDRGALGRADNECVQSIYAAVGDQVPVSMACGELVEHRSEPILPSLTYAKIGLANCVRPSGSAPAREDSAPDDSAKAINPFDWQAAWLRWMEGVPSSVQPIAVVYADHWNANSPMPTEIIAQSQKMNCQGVLVDTFSKVKHRSLFDWQAPKVVAEWVDAAHSGNQFVAVAGSLTAATIPLAVQIKADIVALRGAACNTGRTGEICKQKIHGLSNALAHRKLQRTSVQRIRKDTQDGMSSGIF